MYNFNFTPANRNLLTVTGAELLEHFQHDTAETGMNAMWDVYSANKANVAEVLSRHPNWDPETLCIRLTEEYSTSVDHDKVNEFVYFLEHRALEWCRAREVRHCCMNRNEVRQALRRLRRTIDAIDKIPGEYCPVTVAGMTEEEVCAEYRRMDSIDDMFIGSHDMWGILLSTEDYEKANAIAKVIYSVVRDNTANTLSAETADILNEYAPIFFPVDKQGKKINKARFSQGQKTSKAVTKFFSLMGDWFVQYKDIRVEEWRDQSGNYHSREKDYGWNHYFSNYADSINPIKVKRYTFISINPLDYLTMSFGNGWASCHTIDHENLRPNNGNHTYHGCYQSGTLSYMLDRASIVMYTTKEDIDVCRPWEADKINRCMFHLGEEKFVQGRTYPDGRDNPNNEEAVTIASTFRNIFQRVISECWDVSNLWVIKRNNYEFTESCGTHYRDYLEYRDPCTCILKGSENVKPVHIGHNPICPVCGREHTEEESLHCGQDHVCLNDGEHVSCAQCGSYIHIDNAIQDVDTGNYYCDSYCANNDSVYYCPNAEEWHSENVHWDDYAEEYFFDPDDERISVGCYCFSCAEHATEFGFIQNEDGEWVRA